MRSSVFLGLCVGGAALLIAAACSTPKPEAPATTSAPTAAATLRPTATIKDIMDSVVDPSADYIWESVSTIVTKAGTEERRPRTPEDWKQVRRRAIALIEAT